MHRYGENYDTRLVAGSAWIDVSNFDRVVFQRAGGATANTMQLKQAKTSAGGTPIDIVGAVDATAGDLTGKLQQVEVETRKLNINNGYRWISANVSGNVTFIGMNAKGFPITPDASVLITYVDG